VTGLHGWQVRGTALTLFQLFALSRLFTHHGYFSAETLVTNYALTFEGRPPLNPKRALKELLNLTEGQHPPLRVTRINVKPDEGVVYPILSKDHFASTRKKLTLRVDGLTLSERHLLTCDFADTTRFKIIKDSDSELIVEHDPLFNHQGDLHR
jgi:hypothetical protein